VAHSQYTGPSLMPTPGPCGVSGYAFAEAIPRFYPKPRVDCRGLLAGVRVPVRMSVLVDCAAMPVRVLVDEVDG
jgi:hypothetical protein